MLSLIRYSPYNLGDIFEQSGKGGLEDSIIDVYVLLDTISIFRDAN